METLRPIQYHLEIYESSFANDPSYSLSSSTPMPSFAVGDFIDHRGGGNWTEPPGPRQIFRVADVKHAIWDLQPLPSGAPSDVEPHIGHKLMIRVEVVSTPEV